MDHPYLSVIIPAYNEAKRIRPTLLDVNAKLAAKSFSYEILVINDGSKDDTGAVVSQMSRTIKNLKLVDNAVNHGKGAVVRQGMLTAKGEYRLFMDADNSTAVDQFTQMILYFEKGYDVVIGSRAMRGSRLEPPQPLFRRIAGKVLNIATQLLLLPGIWDTQCGFKAFTARAAEAIFPNVRITGWGFDVEALSLARAMGFRIKEVPIVWKNDVFSHVRMSAGVTFLLENVRIRWWLWTHQYSLTSIAHGR
ncbi:MAG: hypothetical protein A3A43_02100 [Candidatus Liptonbacteria bacterium RIFCSPLOWO2_01_FULL_56_20]|uniref:dolichyl-phosphate beta-glucosyltransferase n=1 Tax=Candidatus Liptonbacteria bacterium RIFCSPLOWO2_01_FULL_56_20 TaxID=1798652 RepID=A0A1G2CJ68_9BACT|nr:MAG: Glycosyl transferase, group 2 family [Parcubacteria group bacterium GW2011_GWB1_56_8]OGY97693.1 MAG: hypothetical protein A2681_00730 [Candidatus Liptonbacteria bacterium RIFCSPHIGHO2_01_FULL_56_18b]OGZ01252.1 MAG: hypothetical protein A3A43_02100 [Candidatus Liptonbacteria bacterium RIFCSPLOWO2_01_FULL_56_20]